MSDQFPSECRAEVEVSAFGSLLDEQPSPLDEQPSPVDEQPSPVDEQPSPVDEQPSPVDEQPSPVDEQPSPLAKDPLPEAPTSQAPSQKSIHTKVSPTITEKAISITLCKFLPIVRQCKKEGIKIVKIKHYSVDKARIVHTGMYNSYIVYDLQTPDLRCVKVYTQRCYAGLYAACQDALRHQAVRSVTGVPVVQMLSVRPAGLIITPYKGITYQELLRCPPGDVVYLRALVNLCSTLDQLH
nr:uncharacterized protein LOC123759791 [Procambarus clarkii]